MKNIFAVCAVLLLSACASAQLTTPEQDLAAKQFSQPPSDKSHLYIFRDEGYGAAVPMTVTMDGQTLGDTAAHTYFFLTIPPGEHKLSSSAENTDELSFNALAGQAHYVWQEVKMGFLRARTKLHLVPEDRGQRGVMKSKRIAEQVDTAAHE